MKKDMKLANLFAKAGEKKLAAHERREAMGKEKDTPAIAKEEMGAMKKAKVPADLVKYEKGEHKAMGFARGGGIESKGKTKAMGFARGGGIESKGKTKAMGFARGGGIESKGKTKVKRYNGEEYGSEVENDNTDAEGYGTKIEGKSAPQTSAPQTFAQKFNEARAKGKGTEFTWNGKKIAAYRAGEEPESWKKSAPKELSRDRTYDKFVHAMAPGTPMPPDGREPETRGGERGRNTKFVDAMAPGAKAKSFDVPKSEKKDVSDKASAAIRTGALQGEINRAQAKRERDMGSYGKDVSMYQKGGSVKKFARGGGIESKGKTRGRFI